MAGLINCKAQKKRGVEEPKARLTRDGYETQKERKRDGRRKRTDWKFLARRKIRTSTIGGVKGVFEESRP